VFTREAVTLIHERSKGIPRLISVIADNALVTGFAIGQRPVTYGTVHEVCEDFDLSGAVEVPQTVAAAAAAPSEPAKALVFEESTADTTTAPLLAGPAPLRPRDTAQEVSSRPRVAAGSGRSVVDFPTSESERTHESNR
jgi:hypothetical protein